MVIFVRMGGILPILTIHVMFCRLCSFIVMLGLLGMIEPGYAALPGNSSLPATLQKQPFPQPYKALYRLGLHGVSPEALTEEATGYLAVEFQDVGNGWTLQQQGHLKILMADFSGENVVEQSAEEPEQNDTQQIEWTYTAWEAKNGRHFRFLWRRWIDGILEEDVQGEVDYDPQIQQGTITYQTPLSMAQVVHGEILFPTAYAGKILEKIQEKNIGFVSGIVFDGTTSAGLFRLNTFVGEPREIRIIPELPRGKNQRGNGSQKSQESQRQHPRIFTVCPTFTAVHHPQGLQAEAESETTQELTPEGLPVTSMLNFGDFTVKANLVLPAPQDERRNGRDVLQEEKPVLLPAPRTPLPPSHPPAIFSEP